MRLVLLLCGVCGDVTICSDLQQGAFSEKDEQLRQILMKLDSIDEIGSLSPEDLTTIRRQLSEGQTLVRETADRLRMSQEENEIVTRRKDELEARVVALETEYEELLGAQFVLHRRTVAAERVCLGLQRRLFMTRRRATWILRSL